MRIHFRNCVSFFDKQAQATKNLSIARAFFNCYNHLKNQAKKHFLLTSISVVGAVTISIIFYQWFKRPNCDLLSEAKNLVEQAKYSDAIDTCKKALEQDPRNVNLLWITIQASYLLGFQPDQESEFQTYINLIIELDNVSDFFLAEIRQNTECSLSHYILARIYRKKRQFDLALFHFQLIRKFSSDQMLTRWASSDTEDILLEADSYVNETLQCQDKSFLSQRLHSLLAVMKQLSQLGSHEEIVCYLNAFLKKIPNEPLLFKMLGKSLYHLERYDEALKNFQKGMKTISEKERRYINFSLWHVRVYVKQEKFKIALKWLNDILQKEEGHPKALLEKGWVLYQMKNNQEAQECFCKVLAQDSQNTQAQEGLRAIRNDEN